MQRKDFDITLRAVHFSVDRGIKLQYSCLLDDNVNYMIRFRAKVRWNVLLLQYEMTGIR